MVFSLQAAKSGLDPTTANIIIGAVQVKQIIMIIIMINMIIIIIIFFYHHHLWAVQMKIS